MANVLEVVQIARRMRRSRDQVMTTGVIVGPERGRYRVSSGQTTYLAETGIASPLKKGDRVYLIQKRGITKIVGLMGADVNV